jgi:hypothetical protein
VEFWLPHQADTSSVVTPFSICVPFSLASGSVLYNAQHWCWVGREISRMTNPSCGLLIRYQWHCLLYYDNTPYRQLCVCVMSIQLRAVFFYRHWALQSGRRHWFVCRNYVFRCTTSSAAIKNYPLSWQPTNKQYTLLYTWPRLNLYMWGTALWSFLGFTRASLNVVIRYLI